MLVGHFRVGRGCRSSLGGPAVAVLLRNRGRSGRSSRSRGWRECRHGRREDEWFGFGGCGGCRGGNWSGRRGGRAVRSRERHWSKLGDGWECRLGSSSVERSSTRVGSWRSGDRCNYGS
ncbi:hypothetical protein FOFC_00992 [Fusarium oxysporum]|nr:hypothetical protein FOFC_00992 [Fusarium oxysporum]